MRRKSLFSLLLPLAMLLLVSPAWSGEESLRPRVLALNEITGSDALDGQFKALLEQPEEAKKFLTAALALAKQKDTPLKYNTALLLAQLASDVKDIAKSEAFFRVCCDQAAKLQSGRKLSQAYGGLIELLYDNKKYADSARVCQELLELKTDDGKERVYYLCITNRLGMADFRAEEDYNPVSRIKSGVHRLQIQSVAKQGKFEQALKLADNLIRAGDNISDRQLRGWVLREAGKFTEAAKTFEDLIERVERDRELEPGEKQEYKEKFRYLLSNVYVELKQIDKAAEHLKALVEAKPTEPAYQNDLGYIWADHDLNLDEAERLIRKALDLDRERRKKINPELKPEKDKDNGAYLDSLGWVLFKKKQYKEAKEVMLKAIEDKDAQHIEIYDHLAEIHLALGEREMALAAWRKGVELAGEGRRETERKSLVEKKIEKHSGK